MMGEMTYAVGPDAVRVVLTEARECACHRMALFVVNRDGKSRCLDCDEKYLREKENGLPHS